MPRDDDTFSENASALKPSLLDRLCQPDGSSGARSGGSSDLKAGIRRDLERMLNTRWRCVGAPADLKELEVSLVNYGLPDCTASGAAVGNNRNDLRRTIERAIQNYEPRFSSVKVQLISNSESTDRTFRFRIDARLHGTAEPVIFDSALETSTATFQVRRAAR